MPSPRYWREVPSRYRLEAGLCAKCGHVSYPARTVCPACRSREAQPTHLSHRGTVITSTVVRTPPDDLQMEAPYAVAIVETPEGARLMAQVVDCDPEGVLPGMEVSLEFRLVRREGHGGIRCYGHKAVPVA
jgi:uncharacterized OB-fold protein